MEIYNQIVIGWFVVCLIVSCPLILIIRDYIHCKALATTTAIHRPDLLRLPGFDILLRIDLFYQQHLVFGIINNNITFSGSSDIGRGNVCFSSLRTMCLQNNNHSQIYFLGHKFWAIRHSELRSWLHCHLEDTNPFWCLYIHSSRCWVIVFPIHPRILLHALQHRQHPAGAYFWTRSLRLHSPASTFDRRHCECSSDFVFSISHSQTRTCYTFFELVKTANNEWSLGLWIYSLQFNQPELNGV